MWSSICENENKLVIPCSFCDYYKMLYHEKYIIYKIFDEKANGLGI